MDPSFHIIINEKSGQAEVLGKDTVEKLLGQHLADRTASLTFITGDTLEQTIHDLAEKQPLPFLIGGGDGSIVSVAQALARHELPFGILPLGTMNLLAQDMGLPNDFETALPFFRDPAYETIDMGLVNGKLFLCSAVIGIVPETAIKREQARKDHSLTSWSGFAVALARGLSGQETRKLTLQQGSHILTIDVSALVISNNAFIPHPDSALRFRRTSLFGGKLAVYGICPTGAMDAVRLAFKILNGTWHEDETVFSFETESLSVSTEDKEILVSLDGEPMTMTSPLNFSITHRGLPVLVPKKSP